LVNTLHKSQKKKKKKQEDEEKNRVYNKKNTDLDSRLQI